MVTETNLMNLKTPGEIAASAIVLAIMLFVVICWICTFPLTIGNIIVALLVGEFLIHSLNVNPIIGAIFSILVYSGMTGIGLTMFRR